MPTPLLATPCPFGSTGCRLGALCPRCKEALAPHLAESREASRREASCCALCGEAMLSPLLATCRRCEREVCESPLCTSDYDYAIDTGVSALCTECARPLRCREEGCTRPAESKSLHDGERESGRCRPHYRAFVARVGRAS